MLSIDYRASDLSAVLSWAPEDEAQHWAPLLRRLVLDHTPNARQESGHAISLPWWNFVALRGALQNIFAEFKLRLGAEYRVSEAARDLLQRSRRVANSYEDALRGEALDEATLRAYLREIGFTRELSPEQARNVRKIAALPAAATFSVPGAGKTTEALATFFYKARESERLLVIAPKNAFAAWDEQIKDCMPALGASFVRLRGGDKIERLLVDDPRFMLIGYQQLALVGGVIAAHLARRSTFVFLDESHRIKSGKAKQTARAVLNLAHLPVGKLIMSGTPMPQSDDDLIPQFSFLYPEIAATKDDVLERVKPIYVRTNKRELGLPPVTRHRVRLPMAPLQRELYRLMKFEVAREARAARLNARGRQAFRALGRSVTRLLQFVSNPSLLGSELAFAKPELLAAVLQEGEGPKLKYVLRRARQLTTENKKVLIWSSYRKNVEYIADRLSDLGAVYIHGSVEAGDEDDDDTREGKIRQFHQDANTMVMVANPAAASEGISLHRVCHHAIYLDRTFNAAHYLQSEDRIHRFGLAPDQDTTIEIVECEETVDETVLERLNYKIGRMAEALEDSSLLVEPIDLDEEDIDGYDEYSAGLSADDIDALIRDFDRESA